MRSTATDTSSWARGSRRRGSPRPSRRSIRFSTLASLGGRPDGHPSRPPAGTVSRATPPGARLVRLDHVTARLPVFPLATVLFPGLVLPLHIFEERYRALVRHLVDLPEGAPREFGVVAIQAGWEVAPAGPGARATPSVGEVTLHEVGCTAELRQVTELADGGFDIVTVGRRRFRIAEVDDSAEPYLTADVEWLPEPGRPGRGGRPAGRPGDRGVPAVPRPDPLRPGGDLRAAAGGPDGALAPGGGHRGAHRRRPAAAAGRSTTPPPGSAPSCGCSTARRLCCVRCGRFRCRCRSWRPRRHPTELPRLGLRA